MIDSGLNQLFSTPVYKTKIDVPTSITEYILTEYGNSNKVSANVSGDNILNDSFFNDFKLKTILPILSEYCKNFKIDLNKKDFDMRAWITGYGTRYAMPKHNHSGSHISAVFYLFCEENNGGNIILHDPRTNANRGYIDEFQRMFESEKFTPNTGDVLVFPSFLYHNVETFNGKMRLAMPVDLTIYK